MQAPGGAVSTVTARHVIMTIPADPLAAVIERSPFLQDATFAAALARAVAFGRWRAADVRSILAAGAGTADPRAAGDALILELPVVPVRPLSDYAIGGLW